ncbi:MAG: 2Fe-2S iron-sulfur cluster-binding protein, partial [Candidatus Mariimomonas ferrooxydans]
MKISLISGKSIATKPGTSILATLKKAGIYLTSSCGGKGTCGKCRIIVKSGPVDTRSKIKVSQKEIEKCYALACQSFPKVASMVSISNLTPGFRPAIR